MIYAFFCKEYSIFNFIKNVKTLKKGTIINDKITHYSSCKFRKLSTENVSVPKNNTFHELPVGLEWSCLFWIRCVQYIKEVTFRGFLLNVATKCKHPFIIRVGKFIVNISLFLRKRSTNIINKSIKIEKQQILHLTLDFTFYPHVRTRAKYIDVYLVFRSFVRRKCCSRENEMFFFLQINEKKKLQTIM